MYSPKNKKTPILTDGKKLNHQKMIFCLSLRASVVKSSTVANVKEKVLYCVVFIEGNLIL